MCCFSGSVREVGGTRIFAGHQSDGRQWLVYEMRAAFSGEVAMVLPLPVPVKSADDAVRFVSFEHLPRFFTELDTVFPAYLSDLQPQSRGGPPRPAALAVHDVGAFVASFVPTRGDFGRLDPRFRLPDAFFTALPRFDDFGFAVFQLKAPAAPVGLLQRTPQHFHPMVLEFPRRDPTTLFFPTVHLHDGEVHATAEFDHVLYAQRPGLMAGADWDVAQPTDGGAFIANLVRASHGVLNGLDPIAKREIRGTQPNADVVL